MAHPHSAPDDFSFVHQDRMTRRNEDI
jgi:hypothetical protein